MEDCSAGVFVDSPSVKICFNDKDLLFGVLQYSSVKQAWGVGISDVGGGEDILLVDSRSAQEEDSFSSTSMEEARS